MRYSILNVQNNISPLLAKSLQYMGFERKSKDETRDSSTGDFKKDGGSANSKQCRYGMSM